MRAFSAALHVEVLKARRSIVPWITAAGFSIAPLMGGFFMVVLKDPERARSMGLISSKAQIVAGTFDWPTYLGLLAQATAVGGYLVFGLVTAWVFGREFVDRTAKEWLATPTPRAAVVLAKLAVILLWAVALTALVTVLGLAVGAAIGLPGWSVSAMAIGTTKIAEAAGLTILLMPVVALIASRGRGYLAPLGWLIFTLFTAQIVAATGWGEWFPWSVPALSSGVAGTGAADVGLLSRALVLVTGALGVAGTWLWWLRADHTR